ncbi:AraC family transcriptional regulator [Aquabacterium sp.]|uniref:AraC family transcriptional regulator n=1 Tax=Aquabacterium sp. TaxID=1872578 RepID=UPI0025BFFF31|nr:AraC family transcriptional regulator [Aquabacterium sp.]
MPKTSTRHGHDNRLDDRHDAQVETMLLRARLAALTERLTPPDTVVASPVPRLTLGHGAHVAHPVHMVYEPALCVIAQGCKEVLVGRDVVIYDQSQALIFAQNLPVTGHVIGASPETPHLAIRLDLDVKVLAELAVELQVAARPRVASQRGIYTTALTPDLLHPLLRLVQMIERPQDIPTLAPLATREILYRLLTGPGGEALAQLAMPDSHSQRVAQVIALLQQRFRETLRIDDLAREVHWSPSALHHHFKAVTAMTPVQYQKQIRLQEARRLLLAENIDASLAGHRVGYDSPSQFNREYSRFFGAPPARDLKRMRAQKVA